MAAEKRYRITAAVAASPNYAVDNDYKFKTGFAWTGAPPGTLVICQPKECPLIVCTSGDVMSTTNEWAQRFMAEAIVPKGLMVNGVNTMGTPGAAVFEETLDAATIDLDPYFS
jgi:hypothetical protein